MLAPRFTGRASGALVDLARWVQGSGDGARLADPAGAGPDALSLASAGRDETALWLYAHFYAACPALWTLAAKSDPLDAAGLRRPDGEFYDRLAAAFPARGWIDWGWRVAGEDPDGRLRVEKDDLTLRAEAVEIVAARRDSGLAATDEAHDRVGLRFPPYAELAAPGAFVGFSEAGPATGSDLVRIYLTVRAIHAVKALAVVGAALSARAIPATMKACADRRVLARRDALVVYAARGHARAATLAILTALSEVPRLLSRDTPAFTLPLRGGVGVAEEPPSPPGFAASESFGMNRCRVAADALLRPPTGGRADRSATETALREAFAAADIDPERPWARSATADDFEALFAGVAPSGGAVREARRSRHEAGDPGPEPSPAAAGGPP